jgi:hypothetical protein
MGAAEAVSPSVARRLGRVADWTADAVRLTKADPRGKSGIMSALAADAEEITQGVSSVSLANQPLWPGPVPVWVLSRFERMKRWLLPSDKNWGVWTDWYEDRLFGRTSNQKLEFEWAAIPNEVWNRGPRFINAEIRNLAKKTSPRRRLRSSADVTLPDISNVDDLRRWLADKPHEWVAIIASRIALRAIPALRQILYPYPGDIERDGHRVILPVFRACAAAWAAARDLVAARANGAAGAAAGGVHRAVEAYPPIAANVAASAVDIVTADSIVAADGSLISLAANAADLYATYALQTYVEADKSDSRGYEYSAATDDVWAAVTFDARALESAARPKDLLHFGLWPLGEPLFFDDDYSALANALVRTNVDWRVWTHWYSDRVRGAPVNEELELARTEISNAVWEEGPRVVNAEIGRLLEKYRSDARTAEIPDIPSQGPGPRFRIVDANQVDRAPASEMDNIGNDYRTINQLRPLVQGCVSDLLARLSRNQFPELCAIVERYSAALEPGAGGPTNWGEVWGLGVLLQTAASAAARAIALRLLPPLEDPAKTALDGLLVLYGPLILATSEGAELSAAAQDFALTREQQVVLQAAAKHIAERLRSDHQVITLPAAECVTDAVKAIGGGSHPERGSIYGLATLKNVSIILIGGAAVATPALVGALLGSVVLGAIAGAPFSLLVVEAVKKNSAFNALASQLGANLDKMPDDELLGWLEQRARAWAPLKKFVIINEEPLRKIAELTGELKWMLRYIDFIVGKER